MSKHPATLRMKIRPGHVETLDMMRRPKGLRMNEATNLSLTIALEAQDISYERNHAQ